MDQNSRLLTEGDVARQLNMATSTLQKWRHKGTGPTFHRVNGRAVRYDQNDVSSFVANSKQPTRPK